MPKPIQISVTEINGHYNRTEVAALCNDGSIWLIQNQEHEGCTGWKRLPDIPDGLTAKDEWDYQEAPEC